MYHICCSNKRVCARVMKTNLMHYLSSVYFVNQPLHIWGIFVANHQEVYCIYTTIGTCSVYIYIYIYSIPPHDGLQICPKHVEVDWRNKLRINSASSWFLLHGRTETHGQQNIKGRVYIKSGLKMCTVATYVLFVMFLNASIGSEYLDDQVNRYHFHSNVSCSCLSISYAYVITLIYAIFNFLEIYSFWTNILFLKLENYLLCLVLISQSWLPFVTIFLPFQ